jgi:hypothetical protein
LDVGKTGGKTGGKSGDLGAKPSKSHSARAGLQVCLADLIIIKFGSYDCVLKLELCAIGHSGFCHQDSSSPHPLLPAHFSHPSRH